MKKILVLVLFATGSPQLLANDSGCEQLAHGIGIALGAASASAAGPAGGAAANGLRALGGWAAYELTSRTATQLICDNSLAIEVALYEQGLMLLCANGDMASCNSVGPMYTSFARDFAVCGGCTVQEVMGAFLMEDGERQRYFESKRRARGIAQPHLTVLPRNDLQLDAQYLTAYYQGIADGLQKSLLESFGSL